MGEQNGLRTLEKKKSSNNTGVHARKETERRSLASIGKKRERSYVKEEKSRKELLVNKYGSGKGR